MNGFCLMNFLASCVILANSMRPEIAGLLHGRDQKKPMVADCGGSHDESTTTLCCKGMDKQGLRIERRCMVPIQFSS